MKIFSRAIFVAVALVWFGTAAAADTNSRFSHALSAPETREAGLDRLTSDQVAVLDALVRRDVTARLNGRGEDAPKTFSQRLSADERRISGYADLTPAEAARLDAFVERYESGIVARALLSPPALVSRHAPLRLREEKAERKIHGSFSLSFGWGSGGYSERTGSMVLHSEIAPGTHVSIGYSESRVKGSEGIYYYRDPYSGPPLVGAPRGP